MKTFKVHTNPEVDQIFNNYPEQVRQKMSDLRKLILESAEELEEVKEIEETLKWNEPSYIAKHGSTIRIDWKNKQPDQYAIYFKCTSKLVPTFKMVFNDKFNFEGDRAIIFSLNDKLPEAELKKCISAGLTYHKVKHLPLLGI